MQKPIWVGIVGCGNAAVFHYASFLRVTGIPVEVVGVTSLQKARHEEFAVRRGIRTIDTLADLLSEVEVIDNCTPGYAHEPVSIAALDAGKHVIVEKPFTGYYGPPGAEAFEENRFPKQTMLTRALSISGRVIAAAPSALAPTRSRAPRPS